MKSVTSFSVLLFDMEDARKMFKLSWSLRHRILAHNQKTLGSNRAALCKLRK